MGLLDSIDEARLVIVDEDARVAYVWFGGAGVNIYDEDGNELDYFSIDAPSKVSERAVRAAIARMIEYSRDDGGA